MKRALVGLGLGVLGGTLLGCTTLLDVERFRQVLLPGPAQEIPVLVESPAARLAPVKGLGAVSGELRNVPLHWDPVLTGAVAGYAIERAIERDGPYAHIGALLGRFRTVLVDSGYDLAPKRGAVRGASGLGDGNDYFYRVRAFDPGGRQGPPSVPVSATTAPPPLAPRAFRAFSYLPRKVALRWDPVPDANVGGYAVYRSPSAQGEYRRIARLDNRFETTYVDEPLEDLRVFYYQVAAVNLAEGEGSRSRTRRAVTKPRPLPPAGLRLASQQLGVNALTWEPNVETDLAGYRLLRYRGDAETAEIVGAFEATVTEARDDAVGAGEPVAYSLIAIDADALESAAADRLDVESIAYGLDVAARGRDVVLRWDPAVQRGYAGARILLEGTFSTREIGRTEGPEFVHEAPGGGRRLRYRVILIRRDGSEAPPSRTVEFVAPNARSARMGPSGALARAGAGPTLRGRLPR